MTPHLLHEQDDVRDVLTDPTGQSVLVLAPAGDHLWQLATGAVDRLPACALQIHGFALAPDRRHLILLGSDRVSAVSDTLCLIDLDSRSLTRLPVGGAPWAWDGARRFASAYQGTEIELWTDPTPDDPADFQAWLADQTPRQRPLTALLPAQSAAP